MLSGWMAEFLTMDDVEVEGKVVLLRIDANVPYDEKTGKISDSDRLKAHANTIKELAEKNAKVVLLAHQGRKGDPDFISLYPHALLLGRHVGREVKFVADMFDQKTRDDIEGMKSGEILLLENVRFLRDETEEKSPAKHSESEIVKALAPLADIFINDAFSAAHRSHASMVGFTAVLPSYAGRVMEREISQLNLILSIMKKSEGSVFILGGAKPKDPLDVMEHMLNNKSLERVLVAGIIGELFLIAKGVELGVTKDYLRKKEFLDYLPQVRRLLRRYEENILMPVDVAVEADGKRKEIDVENLPTDSLILDIGRKTVQEYVEVINHATEVGYKGPAGKYEQEGFDRSTKELLDAMADSGAKTLVGGGHTLEVLKDTTIDRDNFTHVSLGGGSLIQFLSGKKLPAIEALEKSNK